MMRPPQALSRWLLVVVFAIGMAWVEAATVYYLRVMVDRVAPYQVDPLPIQGVLGQVEVVREAATLVMLVTLGALAGRTWHTKAGYTAIAFGVWDLLYYLFLKVMSGWPTSLLEWDVLFLLPLPWWGPVLAPISIALLMIAWGTLVTVGAGARNASVPWPAWAANGLGIVLALYVFMADSLRAMPQGLGATRMVLPQAFNWPMFVVAFALMTLPLALEILRRTRAFMPRAGAGIGRPCLEGGILRRIDPTGSMRLSTPRGRKAAGPARASMRAQGSR